MNLLYFYYAPSGDGESRVGFAITADGVVLAKEQNFIDLSSAENRAKYEQHFGGEYRFEVVDAVDDPENPGIKSALAEMKSKKSLDTLASRC